MCRACTKFWIDDLVNSKVREQSTLDAKLAAMKVDSYFPMTAPEAAADAVREAAELGYDGFFSTETKHDPFLPLALAGAQGLDIDLGTAIAVASTPKSHVITVLGTSMTHLIRRR